MRTKAFSVFAFRSGIGFTLVELLVVIAIIALLAAILFPVFSQLGKRLVKANAQAMKGT